MRFALVIGSRSDGGTYQYGQMVASALETYAARNGDEVLVVLASGEEPDDHGSAGWPVVRLDAGTAAERLGRRLTARMPGQARLRSAANRIAERVRGPRPLAAGVDPALRSWFAAQRIDLALWPTPMDLAYRSGIPYVAAVRDLQHRLQPEFPEVSADGAWEWREFLFSHLIAGAVRVVADSEAGREDIVRLYGLDAAAAARVDVVPYTLPPGLEQPTAAEVERVRTAHDLPARYLFYPAQFWPHKNHERLIEALSLLDGPSAEVPLVLTGSRGGDLRAAQFDRVMARARELGVDGRVRWLGYVPAEDISPLYAGAEALVMPTFFGPTNIPQIEAWFLGCPVITSAIHGIPAQVGDAALLADPRSAEEIAGCIRRVLEEPGLRAELVQRGRARLAAYPQAEFARRFGAVLDAARSELAVTAARDAA